MAAGSSSASPIRRRPLTCARRRATAHSAMRSRTPLRSTSTPRVRPPQLLNRPSPAGASRPGQSTWLAAGDGYRTGRRRPRAPRRSVLRPSLARRQSAGRRPLKPRRTASAAASTPDHSCGVLELGPPAPGRPLPSAAASARSSQAPRAPARHGRPRASPAPGRSGSTRRSCRGWGAGPTSTCHVSASKPASSTSSRWAAASALLTRLVQQTRPAARRGAGRPGAGTALTSSTSAGSPRSARTATAPGCRTTSRCEVVSPGIATMSLRTAITRPS